MARQHRYERTVTIERAMNQFWRNGYTGTSMRQLETSLDMHPGSIYSSFVSKEQLYIESLKLYASKNSSSLLQHFDKAGTFLVGLRHYIESILFSRGKPVSCMITNILSDTHMSNKPIRDLAGVVMAEFEDNLFNELEKAKVSGEIDKCDNLRSLARYIHMQIIGLRSYAEMQKDKSAITILLDDAFYAISIIIGTGNTD